MTNLLWRLRGHRPDVEALSAYADGTLDAPARARLDAHLAGCDACRARLAALSRVRSALASMPAPALPRSFLLRQVDVDLAPTAPHAAPGWRAMPVLGAAAALVFAVVLGADLLTRGSGADDSGGRAAMIQRYDSSAEAGAAAPESATAGDQFDSSAPGPSGVAPPADTSASPTPAAAAALAPDATADQATRNAAGAQEQIQRTDENAKDGGLTSTDDDDGGVRAAFLVAEIILGTGAALAVAAALWSWRKRGTP